MAITYPRWDLFNSGLVGFNTQDFQLTHRVVRSTSQDGKVRPKRRGPGLWRATWQSVPKPLDNILEYEAILNSLEDGVWPFMANDLRRRWPKMYQSGEVSNGTVHTVGSDYKTLRIQGLTPFATIISRGDYIAIDFLTGDDYTYRYFGQAMETVQAVAGITPFFEVRPHLSEYITPGVSVYLDNPLACFILENGSVKTTQVDELHQQISFSAIQSLAMMETP